MDNINGMHVLIILYVFMVAFFLVLGGIKHVLSHKNYSLKEMAGDLFILLFMITFTLGLSFLLFSQYPGL
jgi:flagellar biosynthesis protein FlhB